MAVIDSLVSDETVASYFVGGGYLPVGAQSAASNFVLRPDNTLCMAYTTLGTNNHKIILATSDDFGETWSREEAFDIRTTYGGNYQMGPNGVHIVMDTRGFLYLIACVSNYQGSGQQSPSAVDKVIIVHNRNGAWEKVDLYSALTGLNGYSGITALGYCTYGTGITIHVCLLQLTSGSPNNAVVAYIPWNTTTGLGTLENIGTITGYSFTAPYNPEYVHGCTLTLVPHPTTYQPIISAQKRGEALPTIATFMRTGESAWTNLGDICDATWGSELGTLRVRRDAESGYLLDLYYSQPLSPATFRRRQHALGGGSWSAATAVDYTPGRDHKYGLWFMEQANSTPPDENADTILMCAYYYYYMMGNRGRPTLDMPPLGPDGNQTTITDITITSEIKGFSTMYSNRANANLWFPYWKFASGFAFGYQLASTIPQIRFYIADGTEWLRYPQKVEPTEEEIAHSVRTGFSFFVDDQEVEEFTIPGMLPDTNNLKNPVYRKLHIRNDFVTQRTVSISITADKGECRLNDGTNSDTYVDALGYSFNDTALTENLASGASMYFWYRWVPSEGYETTPVGTIQHVVEFKSC